MADNAFLDLPPRSAKPRRGGLTQVIDGGLPAGSVAALLPAIAPHVDVWKLGWGTAYLDPTVAEKVALLGAAEVRACLGGTLLEVAWLQGKADACLAWAAPPPSASPCWPRSVPRTRPPRCRPPPGRRRPPTTCAPAPPWWWRRVARAAPSACTGPLGPSARTWSRRWPTASA